MQEKSKLETKQNKLPETTKKYPKQDTVHKTPTPW